MQPDRILAALEETSSLVARLDARISASPLVEAWQVRASFLAAERLAELDGTPTRSGDILGLMMGAPLPSPEAYRPATVGFAHWRRCMARLSFSEVANRLLGRSASPSLAAAEAQADWDMEDELSAGARRAIAVPLDEGVETVDSYALSVSDRALEQLRAMEKPGSLYRSLALGLQDVVRLDPDPDYFERIDAIRRRFEADARARQGVPIPSPAGENPVEEFIASVTWEKKPHLGACFAVVPDRLQDLGISANRLSCLSGGTKRLGFEGRLDERAYVGFLRQLGREAKAGIALLDGLEALLGEFGTSPATKCDQRSPLPRILYAFLLLPVVDSPWLQTALELQDAVTQKHLKRLADAGLIAVWGERPASSDRRAGRPVTLWTAARFQADFERAVRRRSHWVKPGLGPLPSPAEVMARFSDIDISVPMSIVYERHRDELVDIDKQFGRFFDPNWWKSRSPGRPVQRQNDSSRYQKTSWGR